VTNAETDADNRIVGAHHDDVMMNQGNSARYLLRRMQLPLYSRRILNLYNDRPGLLVILSPTLSPILRSLSGNRTGRGRFNWARLRSTDAAVFLRPQRLGVPRHVEFVGVVVDHDAALAG
jgi:hypothetical protein